MYRCTWGFCPCINTFFHVSLSPVLGELSLTSIVTRYIFIAASVLLYSTLLGPAFHHLWIYAGSGNANFFYAITLVWSLGLTILVGDTLFAVMRDEWELERPEMKGKPVRQI
jgi:GPI-anchor transamidase subunit U